MELRIVCSNWSEGIVKLGRISWRRYAKRAFLLPFYFLILGIAVLLMSLKEEGDKLSATLDGEKVTFIIFGLPQVFGWFCLGVAFMGFLRVIAEGSRLKKINNMVAEDYRINGNECAIVVNDSGFKYSSFDKHIELKWWTFKSFYQQDGWIILAIDNGVFGIDTSLISQQQKADILKFLPTVIPFQFSRHTSKVQV